MGEVQTAAAMPGVVSRDRGAARGCRGWRTDSERRSAGPAPAEGAGAGRAGPPGKGRSLPEEAPTQAPWWLSGAAPTIDDILEPLEALAKEFEDISERPDAAGHEEPAPVELICVSRVSREHGRTGWATLAVGPTEDGGVRGGWNSGDARRRAELMSVIAGLEALEGAADIRVRCPSHYLLDGVTNWAREARTRNWRGKRGTRIAHDDLWRRLFALTDGRSIKWLSRPDSDSAGWDGRPGGSRTAGRRSAPGRSHLVTGPRRCHGPVQRPRSCSSRRRDSGSPPSW